MNFLDSHCSPKTAILITIIVVFVCVVGLYYTTSTCQTNKCKIEQTK